MSTCMPKLYNLDKVSTFYYLYLTEWWNVIKKDQAQSLLIEGL